MRDAIIIGGGVVGATAAYHLARDGLDVLLIDREDEGRATDAGAGIISPPTSSNTASDAWFDLAVDAFEYYPTLIDELAGETSFARCGLLSVAVSPDEREPFDALDRLTRERQERLGYPEPGTLSEVSAAEARDRFPPLADALRASYYDRAARVDGRLLDAALLDAAQDAGLDVERASAEAIDLDGGAATGVIVDGERRAADAVVVAGGAWSSAFGDQLGVRIPIEPQRGQIIHLDLGDRETGDWPVVKAFRDHYLVPWSDGRVAVGATREVESGFVPRTTAAGVREVLDEGLRVAPGLADAAIAEVRVGLRPVSADGLPVIGPVPGVSGVYLATGHGPTGLTVGPYSGKLVADQVAGDEPTTDVGAFSATRFDG